MESWEKSNTAERWEKSNIGILAERWEELNTEILVEERWENCQKTKSASNVS